MTLKEVSEMINAMGYPYRYSHFTETQAPPYVVYYYPAENDVYGDNSNYANKRQLYIELFTKDKDFAAESTVEAELKKAGLSWYKQRDFLNDDNVYQTTYETEVLING